MVTEKLSKSSSNGHKPIDYSKEVPTRLQSVLLDVTPELARAWLAKAGEGHRTISGPKVQRITRDITSGEYLVTANGIGFDSQGRLIDGRHRLSAVIDAGLPIKSWVIFGLDPVAIDVTDDTRTRTVADMFKMAHEPNYSSLGSTIGHIWRYERKLWGKSFFMGPTKPEVKHWLQENPDVRESVLAGKRASHVMAPTVAAAAHFVFGKINQGQADRFFEQVSNGVGLGVDDPVRRLRERMLADKSAKRKMSISERFAITINAWNAYREGRALTYLKWQVKGTNRQPFPLAR